MENQKTAMTNRELLDRMIAKGRITQEEGWKFFDRLEPVDVRCLNGKWHGRELASGHPMDGMLKASGWFGKYFVDQENVYPLLFEKSDGKLFAADPARLPIQAAERMPRSLIRIMFLILPILICTKKSGARMRMMKFRNKVTAVMLYDRQPIMDIFAKVDDTTLLGITDAKWRHKKGYFFILEYVGENKDI